MTPLQRQTLAVLDAMNEAKVATIITLYDKDFVVSNEYKQQHNRYNGIKYLCEMANVMDVDYWLDYFKVV